ncbi:MAG: phosphomannomutase/phosphoglucomutase [Candidatus Aenigmarchaeota archaeon]|nr:phosphomannomutase/phosphoglucomutase [Candidatus Aenigmarchaeota archaeon]
MEIFRTYDIRGKAPEDLNAEVVYKIGRAFALYAGSSEIIVGRDCRLSSESLHSAFVAGITDQGVDVIDIGLCSTPILYFASKRGPAAMVTASHMTREYNGVKFCGAGAFPVGADTGLLDIKKIFDKGKFPPAKRKGTVRTEDVLPAYVSHCLSFAKNIRPLTVVVDAGNGMGGLACAEIFKHLPCRLLPLFFEQDGSFPNHEANPLKPENLFDLQKAVKKNNADIGAAYDADCDRILFVDEKGQTVYGDTILGLLALEFLKTDKGATVLYDLRTSHAVPEAISLAGGKPERTVVGHALIKPLMKKRNAIFGGELSGHFYFRDNQFAESGDITLILMLKLLSEENKPLSKLVKPFKKYAHSGEINFEVADRELAMKKLRQTFPEAVVDMLDGITLTFDEWWFNARPSRNDPVLRVVVEAGTEKLMREKLALISEALHKI